VSEQDRNGEQGPTAARWQLSGGVRRLSREEIERRFEQRLRDRWSAERQPAVDVFVLGSEVHVQIDLPGVETQDVHAHIEGEFLSVEAQRRIRPPDAAAFPAALERSRGPFRRRVPLPRAVPRARLEYRLEAGVLYVRIVPDEGS
jgi:HSP20 family molecular chaperone IbpA